MSESMSEFKPSESAAEQTAELVNAQVCSVCGVKIQKVIGGDRVLYAVGPAGTRSDLWSKVCRHTQKPGCINQDGGVAPRRL